MQLIIGCQTSELDVTEAAFGDNEIAKSSA